MIWLIGNKGMLGSEVEKVLKSEGLEYIGTDREVDITDIESLRRYLSELSQSGKRPDVIINCSAYTAVDQAEEDAEKCFLINRDGVENIAQTAKETGAALVHVSTDYVFDGEKKEPYRESDSRNPIGVYGRSKAEGEVAVENLLDEHFIVRTAWLYGLNGKNFVSTMLRLFGEKDSVSVVADQYGSPTYAPDLASALVAVARSASGAYGVYHYTNEGETSWYEFASEIYRLGREKGIIGTECEIRPVSTEQYPTKARRPKYSTLSKEKIEDAFSVKVRDWRKGLEDYLEEVNQEREKL